MPLLGTINLCFCNFPSSLEVFPSELTMKSIGGSILLNTLWTAHHVCCQLIGSQRCHHILIYGIICLGPIKTSKAMYRLLRRGRSGHRQCLMQQQNRSAPPSRHDSSAAATGPSGKWERVCCIANQTGHSGVKSNKDLWRTWLELDSNEDFFFVVSNNPT